MPRCQRTFRKLPIGVALPGVGTMRWACSHCSDCETYETVRDGDLLNFANLALADAIRDFGPPDDVRRPVLFLWGLHPECVRETSDKRYDIYLQSGSDVWQGRLQIGHELFHRICSQGRIFHWTHEMLACVFSVRVLQARGLSDYARTTKEQFARHAHDFSIAQMQTAPLSDAASYPPGLYGRAYLTGQELVGAVGWPALCKLARWGIDDGDEANVPVPDVQGWLHGLPDAKKQRACEILGITTL